MKLVLFLFCVLTPPLVSASLAPQMDDVYGAAVSTGITTLNYNAVKKIISTTEGKNFMLSPLTLFQSLAILANGASGEQTEKFLKLMNVQSIFALNTGLKAVKKKINETSPSPYFLDFVNSMWHAFHVYLEEDFNNNVLNTIYADVYVEQGSMFSPPSGLKLNSVIYSRTAWRISGLYPSGIPKFNDTVVAVDGMYFAPRIELPCKRIKMDFFRDFKGIAVRGIEIKGKLSIHYHNSDMVFTMPLINNAYKLIFVKTYNSIDEFLNYVTMANAQAIFTNPNQPYDNVVTIPQFKLDLTMDTMAVIKDLELTDIFDQSKTVLRLMSANASVSALSQRTIFKFNDDACSATYERGDYPLAFDGEFGFFLVDAYFNAILLSGKVADPREPVVPTFPPATGPPGTLIDGTAAPTPGGGDIFPPGGIVSTSPPGGPAPPPGGTSPPGGPAPPPGGIFSTAPPGGAAPQPDTNVLPPGLFETTQPPTGPPGSPTPPGHLDLTTVSPPTGTMNALETKPKEQIDTPATTNQTVVMTTKEYSVSTTDTNGQSSDGVTLLISVITVLLPIIATVTAII